MKGFNFTEYFEKDVLLKRPYLTKAMCVNIVRNPMRAEKQGNRRLRFWGKVEELEGRVVQVITLEDATTIHNAFLDRGFKS